MSIQYLSDAQGNVSAVQLQIPIQEWEVLQHTIPKEFIEPQDDPIPQWQQDAVQEALSRYHAGESRGSSWEEVKNRLRS